jgi:uncharacterized protein (UPF0335 family)
MSDDLPVQVAPGNNKAKSLIEQYTETICNNLDEITALRENIKDAKAEAKNNGLDPKHLMSVVKHKQLDNDAAREQAVEEEALRRIYMKTAGFEVAE